MINCKLWTQNVSQDGMNLGMSEVLPNVCIPTRNVSQKWVFLCESMFHISSRPNVVQQRSTLRTCQTIFLSRNISFPLILSEHRSSRVQITPNRYIVYQIIWIYLKYIFIHTKVSHENTAYNSIFNFSVTHYSLWLLLHRHCHLLCVESVCCIELKREIKLLLLLVCNLHHL